MFLEYGCFTLIQVSSTIYSRISFLENLSRKKYIIVQVHLILCLLPKGLPWWLSSEVPACHAGDAGDLGSVPGLRRAPGGGNGNPLQYLLQENPMNRGAWWATVHGVTESDTTE